MDSSLPAADESLLNQVFGDVWPCPDRATLAACLDPLEGIHQALPCPGHPAAVLVALSSRGEEGSVLLLKRSSDLEQHAGQIGFPGGRRDPEDTDFLATALRESREELGIHAESVDPIGLLSPIEVWASGHAVLPVVALLADDCRPRVKSPESECCWFQGMDELRAAVRPASRAGLKGVEFPLEQGLLWGMSARVLLDLFQRVRA